MLVIAYLLTHTSRPKKLKGQDNRLHSIYNHVAQLHNKELRKLGLYQLVSWLIALMGWTFWIWGDIKHHPFFLRSDGVVICFALCLTVLAMISGIGRKLDRVIVEATLKGVQIERRIKEAHYFRKFVRKRRGFFLWVYKVYRIFPLISLLYPLLLYGITPMVTEKIGSRFLVFTQMVSLGAIGISTLILIPLTCRAYSSSRGPLSLLNHP